ncbi:glycosyltransferase family 2 protein [Cognatilysobacter tabacisoli]|uniref:glycosyltransferase family 2 protein n=1 Tax=Cognatilysobacter tabacisoli TaxID=2315424 RepID=UPI000E6B0937|nr:glycosyltransferase family A protein [Lysobacter tabacisoli]
MAQPIEVSVIIPTYNRRDLLPQALDSVIAQTRQADEVIVIDDGSRDGTGDMLEERYRPQLGERLRYVWQANTGVSGARNHGMRLARGRYFALLDSDDVWLPEKTARQVDWLQARPDYGMCLCDVARVDETGRPIDVFHRRDVIAEDGWILRWVLHNPSLVPASVMMRREVFDDVGGFDESLRTAEDIDYHLRIARRWPIGVVAEPLVRAMRGHEGLSATSSTYDDYVAVMERAVRDAAGAVDDAERHHALASAYIRNARGMLLRGRWRDGARLAARAWATSPHAQVRRGVLALVPFAARRAVRSAMPG